MAQKQGISQKVAVGDPGNPDHVIKPNADGSINVDVAGGSVGATATAANPAYTEGQTDAPLSLDLSGHLRVLDSAVLAALQTPASYLPLPGAAPSGDTTLTHLIPTSITTATTTSLVGATASQSTRVYRLILTCTGANTLVFKTATTAITQVFTIPSTGGILTLDFSGYWWFATNVNEALQITTTTTATVTMDLYYIKSA